MPAKKQATSKTQRSLSKNLEKLATPKTKAKAPPKKTTRKKSTDITVANSRKAELFPYPTFPFRLEDKSENKTCWFACEDHAKKYIQRYNPEYK